MDEEYIRKLEVRIGKLEMTIRHLERILNHQFTERDITDINARDEVLTISGVINLLGLPRHIIYAKALTGEIPSLRIGKRYNFSRNKVIEWYDEKFNKPTDIDEFVEMYLQKNVLKG